MTDVRYWIWLSSALPPASKHLIKLLEVFGDPKAVFSASKEELEGASLPEDIVNKLSDKSTAETSEIYKYCLRSNVGLLPYDSPVYPKRLKMIENPPALLYFKGTFPDIDDNVCIAAVGTRSITEYGRRAAYTVCFDLASAGALIVSGLARGIDSVCHTACIDASGTTVAVLGCGIDIVYPKENAFLYSDIIAHGAIITEFKPGTPPYGSNFPMRNRIISGLSLGTLVIEADEHSGSLITASVAKKQGRDLFALPGKVGEQNSAGTNKLLKEGAKIVIQASDVLEDYELLFPHRIKTENIKSVKSRGSIAKIMSGGGAFAKDPLPKVAEESTPLEKSAPDEPFEKEDAQKKQKKKKSGRQSDKESGRADAEKEPKRSPDLSKLDEKSAKIYSLFPDGKPILAEDLLSSGYSISEILVSLTVLEINQFIKAVPGAKYIKL